MINVYREEGLFSFPTTLNRCCITLLHITEINKINKAMSQIAVIKHFFLCFESHAHHIVWNERNVESGITGVSSILANLCV